MQQKQQQEIEHRLDRHCLPRLIT